MTSNSAIIREPTNSYKGSATCLAGFGSEAPTEGFFVFQLKEKPKIMDSLTYSFEVGTAVPHQIEGPDAIMGLSVNVDGFLEVMLAQGEGGSETLKPLFFDFYVTETRDVGFLRLKSIKRIELSNSISSEKTERNGSILNYSVAFSNQSDARKILPESTEIEYFFNNVRNAP